MQFQVKRKYVIGGAEDLLAEFKDQKDAEAFIEKVKAPQEAGMNIKVVYSLYEMGDLVKEFDPGKMTSAHAAASDSAGSQSASSGQSFKPSPFDMTPRPGGMPKKWVVDEEDKSKDK